MKRNDKPIATGTYGSVYEATHNSEKVAVKVCFIVSKHTRARGALNIREVDSLKRCDYPYITFPRLVTYSNPFSEPLPDCGQKYDNVFITLDLALNNGYHLIRTTEELIPAHLKRIGMQITQAIGYLHAKGMMHRDIKLSNVLLFWSPRWTGLLDCKVGDFGMCKRLNGSKRHSVHVGTSYYRPPEIALENPIYGYSSDIWALGIVWYELFNKCRPFDGNENNLSLVKTIFAKRGTPDEETFNYLVGDTDAAPKYEIFSNHPFAKLEIVDNDRIKNFEKKMDDVPNFGTLDQYIDLIERMIVIDPRRRLTINEVLQHRFFSEVPRVRNSDWFGLVQEAYEPMEYHILTKSKNPKREVGTKAWEKLHGSNLKQDTKWQIIFLGLDIYDRCLLRMEELQIDFATINILHLAMCCINIAVKYYHDIYAPNMMKLFTERIEDDEFETLEKLIFEKLLDWKIYRITVYECLDEKIRPDMLLKTLIKKDKIYGNYVNVIAQIYLNVLKNGQ